LHHPRVLVFLSSVAIIAPAAVMGFAHRGSLKKYIPELFFFFFLWKM
jgi:hypothetical protein